MPTLETWELASYIVTVIGLPLAIAVFLYEQRKRADRHRRSAVRPDLAGVRRAWIPRANPHRRSRSFFLPIDEKNERWEGLHRRPEWSFYGDKFPKREELLSALNRVVERHPSTNFISAHVANNAEDLKSVGQWLDKYPNLHVEIASRISELGRQPYTARAFFLKYQDRILFGTDAVPRGDEYPQQVFGDMLYEIYYRFLETEDEYFDYAPARKPRPVATHGEQGRRGPPGQGVRHARRSEWEME